jgi:hypothetical protein
MEIQNEEVIIMKKKFLGLFIITVLTFTLASATSANPSEYSKGVMCKPPSGSEGCIYVGDCLWICP